MNIWGHQNSIKLLQKSKKFWRECTENAIKQKLFTEENVCYHYMQGEIKKMEWHQKQIELIRTKRGGKRYG